mmetsp:Transcript_34415/g.81560  ORF Transcript_34415/g.81560 Transcript_34415/m.81560 type:complete len:251 (+) Transcript_34415:200-952(+)
MERGVGGDITVALLCGLAPRGSRERPPVPRGGEPPSIEEALRKLRGHAAARPPRAAGVSREHLQDPAAVAAAPLEDALHVPKRLRGRLQQPRVRREEVAGGPPTARPREARDQEHARLQVLKLTPEDDRWGREDGGPDPAARELVPVQVVGASLQLAQWERQRPRVRQREPPQLSAPEPERAEVAQGSVQLRGLRAGGEDVPEGGARLPPLEAGAGGEDLGKLSETPRAALEDLRLLLEQSCDLDGSQAR